MVAIKAKHLSLGQGDAGQRAQVTFFGPRAHLPVLPQASPRMPLRLYRRLQTCSWNGCLFIQLPNHRTIRMLEETPETVIPVGFYAPGSPLVITGL